MIYALNQKPKKETSKMLNNINIFRGRDSSVDVVTRLCAGKPGFEFCRGNVFFLFSEISCLLLVSTQDPVVTGGSFLGVTAAGA